jgi:hypothetical protein
MWSIVVLPMPRWHNRVAALYVAPADVVGETKAIASELESAKRRASAVRHNRGGAPKVNHDRINGA